MWYFHPDFHSFYKNSTNYNTYNLFLFPAPCPSKRFEKRLFALPFKVSSIHPYINVYQMKEDKIYIRPIGHYLHREPYYFPSHVFLIHHLNTNSPITDNKLLGSLGSCFIEHTFTNTVNMKPWVSLPLGWLLSLERIIYLEIRASHP